jgi:putative inorganic carbon (HCO3(-)) transporter
MSMFDYSIDESEAPAKSFRSRGVNVPLLVMSVFAVSLVLAFSILQFGAVSFLLFVCALIAIPSVYIVLAYPKTGILLMLTFAYLIMFLGRFRVPFPMGTLMDVVEILLMFSFFLRQKYQRNWSFMQDRTTVVIVIWVLYNLLESINPWADSRLAWLYAVRPIALVALTYFIFEFFIDDVKFIRTIFKLWIALSVIAAVYGLKQEFIGFAQFEKSWITSDKTIEGLYFIGGHWRKFSIFSDPVAFAYNMVISSLLCFSLMTGAIVKWKKWLLGMLGGLFFFAMLYSGTRGAYVLYPAAFLLYSILKYNRKVMIVGLIAVCFATILIIMPTSNYTLYRFQTAFKPNKDPSYILRKNNQKKIQPFILTHPLGGGIGSTGVWGQRFSPYSRLASFPPDSGYVRVAVEAGWLGLLVFCTFIFVVLRTGIVNFFEIRDPELKSFCLAMLMVLFVLNIGKLPTGGIGAIPH